MEWKMTAESKTTNKTLKNLRKFGNQADRLKDSDSIKLCLVYFIHSSNQLWFSSIWYLFLLFTSKSQENGFQPTQRKQREKHTKWKLIRKLSWFGCVAVWFPYVHCDMEYSMIDNDWRDDSKPENNADKDNEEEGNRSLYVR